ncbi:hypothetical protein B0T24DRAFT_697214, partial [Lasiosphaeria ovina]
MAGSTAAALLCAALTHHLSSRLWELGSIQTRQLCAETVCWLVLPVLVRSQARSHTTIWNFHSISKATSPVSWSFHSLFKATSPVSWKPPRRSTNVSNAIWVFAAGAAAAACYHAEAGVPGLLPALTPLLLITENRRRPELQVLASDEPWSLLSPLANTVWGTGFAAAVAIFALSNWGLQECLLSAALLGALVRVYIHLLPAASSTTTTKTTATILDCRDGATINVEEAIVDISLCVVPMLAAALLLQALAFGLPGNIIAGIVPTLVLGLAKALSWYFTIRTAHSASWRIAAPITVFGIVAAQDPFLQSTDTQALAVLAAAFLTLAQVIAMLPKQTKRKWALWALFLLPLGPYLANISAIKAAQAAAPQDWGTAEHQHPVEALMRAAREQFDQKLARQSKDFATAEAEYVRRYGVEPPAGFEAWHTFAMAHGSLLIDDFDTIFDSVSPFWRLSGREVQQVMADAYATPGMDVFHCAFSGHTARTACRHPKRSVTFDRNIGLSLTQLLAPLAGTGALPDIQLLVNRLDEPRVVVPPPATSDATCRPTNFTVTDLSHRPTWDALTRHCSAGLTPSSNATATTTTTATSPNSNNNNNNNKINTYGLPFLSDLASATDLCHHPEYSRQHGLLQSPTTFSLVRGLVPILSPGRASTMGDVLFPAPAYGEPEFAYDARRDVPWAAKRAALYWAGSNTGGFAGRDGWWASFHRQRFVALAGNRGGRVHAYLRREGEGEEELGDSGGGNGIARVLSGFLDGRLYDVAFTHVFGCASWRECREQRGAFGTRAWADRHAPLRSQLVFDVDGNGISGRFYMLLASRSAPLKLTLLREWHDDRLAPWVHYVPVSMGLEELPEMVFYLTSTDAGRQRAREIADRGREWFAKAFRDVDLTIYLYRLMLELARLHDPDREA